MAYEKYTTDALVLGSFERGESDKTIVLITRDFGFVYGRATGVRKESSRMRYALQDFSRASVSLVRGKTGWRIAGAHASISTQGASAKGITSFVRLARLTRRLVQGEEINSYLFDSLAEAHAFFMKESEDNAGTVELLCVARILHSLGYLSSEALGTALFMGTSYDEMHISEAAQKQKDLLKTVNEALSESQL